MAPKSIDIDTEHTIRWRHLSAHLKINISRSVCRQGQTMVRCFIALLLALACGAPVLAQDKVQFNRDIRPILSDACYHCHGPDKVKRKAAVHFDTEEGARVDLGGYFAIVPGKPNESELLKRVTSADP